MSESEKAKVIVVVEAGGKERRYDADSWALSAGAGAIDIERTSRKEDPTVAHYAPGAFLSVREDGASTGDPYFTQGKKLAIALDALRVISERFVIDDLDEDLCRVLNKIACDAFEQIADVDL